MIRPRTGWPTESGIAKATTGIRGFDEFSGTELLRPHDVRLRTSDNVAIDGTREKEPTARPGQTESRQ